MNIQDSNDLYSSQVSKTSKDINISTQQKIDSSKTEIDRTEIWHLRFENISMKKGKIEVKCIYYYRI
jgi:hypothetical protein